MKKILFSFLVLVLGLGFIACKPKVKEDVDPAQAKLDAAYSALILGTADPSAVITSFYLNGRLSQGAVSASWVSSNPGVATVGELITDGANAGKILLSITRPVYEQPNAPVTLTATLSIPSELTEGKILTASKVFNITVSAETIAPLNINSIADVLALRDPAISTAKTAVTLHGVTMYAKGEDGGFGYDGTGSLLIYIGTGYELDKVYTISGTLSWYFGIWEVMTPVFTLEANATPQYPTKEVITSVNDKLAELNQSQVWESSAGNAADGCFEPIYATLTGKLVLNPNESGTSNYRFYIVDTTAEGYVAGTLVTNTVTNLEATSPANGFMIYYHTNNFNLFAAYVGIEVTLDVVIYTYRSNNNAYAIYYVGGPDGIDANLTDQQVVNIDAAAVDIPTTILANTTVALPTVGANGATITWASDDETHFNSTTGVVTIPEAGTNVTVTVTATVSYGEATNVVRTFTVSIGELVVTDIADLWALQGATTIATSKQVKVIGVLTDISNFYTAGVLTNSEGFIQDATGGAYLYRVNIPEGVNIGDTISVVGYAYLNSSSGLRVSGEDASHTATIKKVDPITVNAVSLDLVSDDNRVDYRNELVTVSGVLLKKGSNYYVSALNGNAALDIQLYVRSAGYFADGATSRDPIIAALEAGLFKNVTVTAPLYLYTTTWEFNIDKLSQFVVGEALSIPELTTALAFVVSQFTGLPANLAEVTSNIALPTGAPAGLTLAVTSSNTDVISLTGAVTRPGVGQEDAVVTFTVELKKGEEVIYSYSATLTVPALTSASPVYVQSGATIDFGSAVQTGYSQSSITTNGITFTTTLQVQTNKQTPGVFSDNVTLCLAARSDKNGGLVQVTWDVANIDAISFEYGWWKTTTGAGAGSVFKVEKYVGDQWVDASENLYNSIPFSGAEGPADTGYIVVTGATQLRITYQAATGTTGNTDSLIQIDNLKYYTLS